MGYADFGVQSYCFRHFKDNKEVAAKVKEIGVSAIEVCAVHVDFNDPSGWDEAIAAYKDQGVEILSIGVQTFTGDEAKERQWFEFAQKAGAKYISAHFRIDSYQTAIPVAEKLCEEFDMKIAIHCHGGYMFGGSFDVLSHILSISGPRIGICLDTAWCMQAKGDPVKWAKDFGDRLHGLHYKDFVFDRSGQWEDVVVGSGNLDLPGLVAVLEENNFAGYSVIEYEADVEAPVPALTECVNSMREVTAPA